MYILRLFFLLSLSFSSLFAWSWEFLGDLDLSAGVGFFTHKTAPPSQAARNVASDQTLDNKARSLQVGPAFLGSFELQIKHKSSRVHLEAQINHISSLYSEQELYSSHSNKLSFGVGYSYQFYINQNLDNQLKFFTSYQQSGFYDLTLSHHFKQIFISGKNTTRIKSFSLSFWAGTPLLSEYSFKIYESLITDSSNLRGVELGFSVEFQLSKKLSFYSETSFEHFEAKIPNTSFFKTNTLLLKPLEMNQQKMVVDRVVSSFGTRICF